MPNGTVKFFDAAKKFGFVSPDDGGKDVFVPIASVIAAGVSALIAGQRVSFETAPDGRGPKAVNLKLIDIPAPASPVTFAAPSSKMEGRSEQLTFYYDPASENACNVLAELRAGGFEPRVVDYVATPPSADELKKLSMLLRHGSLVRRFDPLFHDLRLDDRFLSQSEFWGGIFENPNLINGPVLATRNTACICRSEDVVKHFIADIFPGRTLPALEEKPAAERAVARTFEDVATEVIAANRSTSTLEPSHVEPVVSLGEPLAKMTARAQLKKKMDVGYKAAATKTAKTTVREATLKSTPAMAKSRAVPESQIEKVGQVGNAPMRKVTKWPERA